MRSVEYLVKLAARFSQKLAQTVSAQPGDIERALSNARVKPSSQDIAPFLNMAKVPDDVSLDIKVVVDPKLSVKFLVTASPPSASANALKSLLDRKYSTLMSQALQKAGLQVTSSMAVNIATF